MKRSVLFVSQEVCGMWLWLQEVRMFENQGGEGAHGKVVGIIFLPS